MRLSLFQSPRKVKHSPDAYLYNNVRIIENTRARRMTLRLHHKSRGVVLSMPTGYPLSRAYQFIDDNEDWIASKCNALPDMVTFEHGAIIPIFGRDVAINIIQTTDTKRTVCNLEGDILHVTTNLDDPSGRITRHLKRLAKDEFDIIARDKAAQINKPIQAISVRDTTSRWGSCSSDGRISLSWRLMFAPYHAMDYVIAHEVAHLKHLDHGKKFWALCEKLSIDKHTGHQWMRLHGHSLMRFG